MLPFRRVLCSGWAMLAFLGAAYIIRGLFFLPSIVRASDRVPMIENLAPLFVWVLVWVAVGGFALAAAFTRRWMVPAVSVCVAVCFVWAMIYAVAWIAGESASGYVTALTFTVPGIVSLGYFSLIFARMEEGDADA